MSSDPPAASAITPLDLEPIKNREAAAAFGPWKRIKSIGDTFEVATPRGIAVAGDVGLHICDAEFIAHARTDIPALVAEVEQLRVEIRRLQSSKPTDAEQLAVLNYQLFVGASQRAERAEAEIRRLQSFSRAVKEPDQE